MELFFRIIKYGLYSLLAVNVFLFFRHATAHEGIDSIGWLLLLFIFEWETQGKLPTEKQRRTPVLIAVQIVAYSLIFYAWIKFGWHGQWLDFVNATLWLGVVGMIESDIYLRRQFSERANLHRFLKISLYVSLIAISVYWGITGDLLNFYDAALWIVCFFAIEVNLLPQLLGLRRTQTGL